MKYEVPSFIDFKIGKSVIGQTYNNPYCECRGGCSIKPPNPDCKSGMAPNSGSCQSGGFPSAFCHVGSAASHH
jgi:hypothetical protein